MLKEIIKTLFSNSKNRSNNDTQLEACLDGWKKYREDLITQKLELEKDTDKTIFAISSGAIGVSLAFLDKLAPSSQFSYLFIILGIGWLALVLSLVFQALSFIKSVKKINNTIGKVEDIINSESLDEIIKKEDNYYSYWQQQNKKIDRDNKYAFICMIAGIFLLLSFAFTSLFTKETKQRQQINITFHDSLINKSIPMATEKENKDYSKRTNEKPIQKSLKEGKVDSVKQAQQIKNPPIKTKPKDK